MSEDSTPSERIPRIKPLTSPRRFNPLPTDHPSYAEPCPACGEQLGNGQPVTLVALGPGDSPEDRAKARDGRPHNAVAQPVHWACATGEEE